MQIIDHGMVQGAERLRTILAISATCNSGMTASTTTIMSSDLVGYGDDYFNSNFYMQVVKNANSIGTAPDGDLPRRITDYVSSSGTFTVDAFSANVEETDEILILHKSVMLMLTKIPEVGDWALSDYDLFDVADADADNERWNPEYISGAAGGSADINTSTSGKLHVHAAYNVAGAIRYAVSHNLPFYGDFFKVEEDVSITWGSTASATAKAVGVLISAGTAYDSNNYIAIERQKGTGVDRVQVRYNLNNIGEVTVNAAVTVTDDTIAFKIERMDQTWSLFYSTIQMANGVWDWVKVTQVEDPSNYMTNQFTYYQEAFNGAAGDANESAIGDFDNFYYHLGTGGGSQYIAGDYSSAWISADIDGSVFERLESIQQALSINASGEFEQDGVPDLWDALVIDSSGDTNIVLMTGNRNGAIIERLAAVENTIGITDAATLTGYEEDGTGANLFKTLVAVQGATSAAGTTATFVDAARTEGASYWIGNLIVALSGSAAGQVRTIVADSGAGTLTVEPLLSAAPGASAVYVILKTKCSDWIIGDNTNNNAYSSSNIVFNSDGSVLERLEHLLVAIGGTTGTTTSEGTTTTAISTALTQAADYWNGAVFVCIDGTNAGLARPIYDFVATTNTVYFEPGFPNLVASGVNYLILTRYDVARIIGDNNADNAISTSTVLRNDDGSVLERLESIIEDLRGAGGIVTWPGAANIGDTVSIAEAIRAILTSIVGGDDYDAYTNISNSANASLNAIAQKFATVIGIDAGNTFSTTIQGSARTTIEAAFDGLADYISPSGATWSVTMNNGAAQSDIETTIETILTWIGIDGTNQLTALKNVVPTTLNAVIQSFAATIGIDGANTYAPNMFGATPGTIEASFTALGTALGAEYDGSPDLYDTIVTGYDSSGIAANADGSALERLEFIQSSLIPDTGGLSFKGTISTGGSATSNKIAGLIGYGDDYFNAYYYMQIIRTTDGLAPVGEVRKITDYTSADGTFVTDAFSVVLTALDETIIIHETIAAIGRDDADNTISTSVVTANENGSILERLEQIQEAVNVGTGSNLPTNKSLYDILGATYVDAGGGLGADSVLSDLGDIHTHADDIDTDLGEPGDAVTINGSVHSKLNGIIAALEITAAGGGKFEIDGVEGLWTQLKEIPASDGTSTWNNTALASINAEVVDVVVTDNKLDKLIVADDRPAALVYPSSVAGESILAFLMSKSASPAASSFDNTTDSFEMLSDKLGGFSGDGGALQDDSVKASLDLAHTDLDAILADTANLDTGLITSGPIGIIYPSVDSPSTPIEFDIADINDDFVSDGEITAVGTIVLYRYRKGTDAAWTEIISTVPAKTALGTLAYSYTFPNASWATGDLVQVHMQGGQITLGAKAFALPRKTIYGVVGLGDMVGVSTQIASTTIDLQQIAGSYTLFTGTTQDIILQGLIIRLPNINVSDDVNITSISIQTNDTTPQPIITSAQGAKANLTAESQLSWEQGSSGYLIKTGKLIQLTIAGGAADAATVCDVVAIYKAKKTGGYLA